MTADESVAILALVTSLVIGWIVLRRTKHMFDRPDNPLPPEVRERSHAVANEATAVRANLRQLAKAPNPIAELIRTIARKRQE